MNEDINVSKTDPIIKNTLPEKFDKSSFNLNFRYNLGKSLTEPNKLFLTLDYLVTKNGKEKIIGTFQLTTTYTIHSEQTALEYLQIFYYLIEAEMIFFREKVRALNIKNYPLVSIVIPSFQIMFPQLEELFYPSPNLN